MTANLACVWFDCCSTNRAGREPQRCCKLIASARLRYANVANFKHFELVRSLTLTGADATLFFCSFGSVDSLSIKIIHFSIYFGCECEKIIYFFRVRNGRNNELVNSVG